jgi:tRNA threonylcarbamoyladenosine biosynthesis protein TsaE
MNLKRYNLINLKDTETLSFDLKELLSKKSTRQIVFLEGDLGTGKTTLAQHLLKNLGVTDRVKSPTYTLIEPYQGLTQKIYHMDLYRLQDVAELEHLGLDDLLCEPAVFLVEWPDKLKAYGVQPDIIVHLTLLPDGVRAVELAY